VISVQVFDRRVFHSDRALADPYVAVRQLWGFAVLVEFVPASVKDPGSRWTYDFPAVGQEIAAVVLGAVDLQRQVHLSSRPSGRAVSWLTDASIGPGMRQIRTTSARRAA